MSKKQNPKPQENFQQAYNAASQPSALETKLQGIASNDIDLINKGDYTKLPHDIFFNFADPAQQARQRELAFNTKGQGVFGLGSGGANPNLLALAKQNLKDEQAQGDAQAYEQAVSQGAQNAYGAANDLTHLDQARRLGVLGASVAPYQTQLAKQKSWFDRLMEGLQIASSNASRAAAAGG